MAENKIEAIYDRGQISITSMVEGFTLNTETSAFPLLVKAV